ncbi:MAG: class I SAM-dependent methyltransferase [Elusimicrobiales bacterium]|nr:class I SAM-dependent methyltransferase [Elusimicrobiales bacterium]
MPKTNPDVRGESSVKEWYRNYYSKSGLDRNDIRLNPGVLFQILAAEAAFVAAIREVERNPSTAKVLDVGCGSGGDMFQLFRIGYLPENVYGVDIQRERLEAGKNLCHLVNFLSEDASKMSFNSDYFDLVFESTMFATLPDDKVRAGIASEMMRVCKSGGHLLLLDWRTHKPGDSNYKALSRRELQKLFKVGVDTEVYNRREKLDHFLGRPKV